MKWLFLAELPVGLFGGLLVLFTSIFSYVAVTTPPKWRAMRLTIVELAMFSGTTI